MEAHGVGGTVHMVPELKTLWTRNRTLRADETGCVSMCRSAGLNVKIATTWKKKKIQLNVPAFSICTLL